MGSPVTSAEFFRLMDLRLRKVTERTLQELPEMIPEVYNVMPSDSAWEEFFEVGAVPDVPEFFGKLTYLPIAPGFHTRLEPKEYGAGVQFERKLIDDKKYGVFDNKTAGLMESAYRVREKDGVKIFANAFSAAFDFAYHEEGIALCGTHLTKAVGVSTTTGFTNAGTSPFSKGAVATTRLAMRRFKNDVGARTSMPDDMEIWCPDNLADDAFELVRTPAGYKTADSDVNMMYRRFEIKPYLRLDDHSTSNWYMTSKSRRKQMAIWVERIRPEQHMTVDFESFITKVATYFRHAYGFIGWPWIYGHNVT